MTSLWKLDSVLPYFGLDAKGFGEVLATTGAFVAGGSCLAAFLGTSIREGQDMDIWLPSCFGQHVSEDAEKKQKFYNFESVALLALRLYLESRGYKRETNEELCRRLMKKQEKDTEYFCFDYNQNRNNIVAGTIRRIHNFYKIDKDGKDIKIQLMECYDVSVNHILSQFDLTICQFYTMTSWPNKSGYTNIYIHHPEETTNPKRLLEIHGRIMRPVPNSTYCEGSKNTINRIKKYEARGFRLELDDKKEYI